MKNLVTSHTSGPWTLDAHGGICKGQIEIASPLISKEMTDGEWQANARLIAAAPDLLASLMRVIRETEGSPSLSNAALMDAQDAIAKATK